MEPDAIISFDPEAIRDGTSEENFEYRPIDTSRLDEKAVQDLYNTFVTYFQNNGIGFRWSAFEGYDLHGVLAVWQYCYAVNYIEDFDPQKSVELHEANQNFLWQPPLILDKRTSEYFFAKAIDGENPALYMYVYDDSAGV